ncbi:MAG TPA: hypothetical protein VLY03_06210 [Bacteroidota bacterium]|nr:hypothetical protein [Bacteroidota bacterium]
MNRAMMAVLAASIVFFSLIQLNCTSNSSNSNPVNTSTPITANLLPLVAGHSYTYSGYLVDTNTVKDSVPGIPRSAFSATWTLEPGLNNTWLFLDSTTILDSTRVKILAIRKDSATGDFAFLQTLGPFYRAVHANYTDTALWVTVARPSLGMNTVWKTFDTTINGTINGIAASIQLQIFGVIEAHETITDSSSSHNQFDTYRIRTYRTITVGPISISTTTAYLWLAADVGPVQIDIAGDPENYGFYGVLANKNF